MCLQNCPPLPVSAPQNESQLVAGPAGCEGPQPPRAISFSVCCMAVDQSNFCKKPVRCGGPSDLEMSFHLE